jgi:ubiquinone/menaquinone biosynthesis C-methylase UbiE
MANVFDAAAQLAGNSLRFGWFYGVNWLVDREAQRLKARPRYTPRGPVPSRQEILADLAQLLLQDAEAVRQGYCPPDEPAGTLMGHLGRVRDMLADLPAALERRVAAHAATAREAAAGRDLPDYFRQDFHYQTGGYLTDHSARLYDVQVETLFYGSAAAMRRSGLRPIVEYLKGRDQRQASLLDVACGTGRFLRQVRLLFPALRLEGLDLSRPYLEEARRHMGRLRPAEFLVANAEAIPLPDESRDIISCVFLFHELPPAVRRTVASEIARVLKPGGLLVFIDSLQMGDKPGWDGLLEAFPERFHEPYYRHYTVDDLDGLFSEAGLMAQEFWLAFMSKVMVRRKPA